MAEAKKAEDFWFIGNRFPIKKAEVGKEFKVLGVVVGDGQKFVSMIPAPAEEGQLALDAIVVADPVAWTELADLLEDKKIADAVKAIGGAEETDEKEQS